MNNDLEQFSEERLMALIHESSKPEIEALARIALAVKQAKPDYYIVRLDTVDAWGGDIDLTSFEDELSASKCKDDYGGVIIRCYTTPQPAHTEQDGWIKCSERMPTVGDVVLTAYQGATNIGEMERSGKDYRYFTSIASGRELPADFWMPLPAAPKPESE